MIFDYLRSCYSIPARIYRDSDDTVTLRWYKAQPGAKVYPFSHAFGSHVWDDSTTMGPLQSVGEFAAPQNWSPNRVSPLPGTCLPDDTFSLLYGLDSKATVTPTTLCCNTLAVVDCGELAFSGSYGYEPVPADEGDLAFSGSYAVYKAPNEKAGAIVFCGCGTLIPPDMIWLDTFAQSAVQYAPPHTPLIGGLYVSGVGSFYTSSLVFSANSSIDGDYLTWDDAASRYRYDFDLLDIYTDVLQNSSLNFMFRWTDASNHFRMDFQPWNGVLNLLKVVGGVATIVSAAVVPVANRTTWHFHISEDGGGSISYGINFHSLGGTFDPFNLGATAKGFRFSAQGALFGTSYVQSLIGRSVYIP